MMNNKIVLSKLQIQKIVLLNNKVKMAKSEMAKYIEGLADGINININEYYFDLDNLYFIKIDNQANNIVQPKISTSLDKK